MNDYNNFEEWLDQVFSVFWASGRFFEASVDVLHFLYEDDASPEEVFELYGF